jgi:hypothetical protein
MNFQAKILGILLIFVFYSAKGQLGGLATYQFLEHSNSTTAALLGGKNISNPYALDLIYYNPALLDSTKTNLLSANYQIYLAGIGTGEIIWALPKSFLGNLAIGVHYINYGKFDKYDESGYYLGTFNSAENAPYITYSLRLDSHVTIGANFKFISSNLETYSSYGYAFDLGLLITYSSDLYFAFAIRNLGKQIKPYNSVFEPLPLNISIGATGKFKYSPFRFNFTLDYLNKWNIRYASPLNEQYLPMFVDSTATIVKIGNIADEILRHTHFGIEFLLNPNFKILIGYNYRRAQELSLPIVRTANGFSAGFILNTHKFNVSYAIEKYQKFSVHTFGIDLKLRNIFIRKIRAGQQTK